MTRKGKRVRAMRKILRNSGSPVPKRGCILSILPLWWLR